MRHRVIEWPVDSDAGTSEGMAADNVGESGCNDLVLVALASSGCVGDPLALLRIRPPDSTWREWVPSSRWVVVRARVRRVLDRLRNLYLGVGAIDVAARASSAALVGFRPTFERALAMFRTRGGWARSCRCWSKHVDALWDWARRVPIEGRILRRIAFECGRGHGTSDRIRSVDPVDWGFAV